MYGLYRGLILSLIKFSGLRSLSHITGTYQKYVSGQLLPVTLQAGVGNNMNFYY